jgi:hypothetical protein
MKALRSTEVKAIAFTASDHESHNRTAHTFESEM